MKPTTESVHQGNKLIQILMFTLVISVMNVSMFNIALPGIRAEFHLSAAQVSWVSSAYMLVYAVGSVTYGKLADKYALKKLITIGLIVFVLGSVFGLAAGAYWMIVIGRVFQAAGSSVIPAAAMIIPVRYFPPETRGRALGKSAIGLAVGNTLAPVVSGLIMGYAGWRWLFCFSVLVLLTLPFYRKYLDDAKESSGRMDVLGGGLLAASTGLILFALTGGGWIPAAAGALLLILFVIRIRKAADPFVQPRLFRNLNYTFGIGIAFVISCIAFSIPFLIPQLLTQSNHLDASIIGLIMIPGAAASALLGFAGGKFADLKGNLFVVCIAALLQMIGFFLLSAFAGINAWIIAVVLIFSNVGQTFMQVALSNTVSRTLAKEETGVGMGLLSMLNFIGAAVATSVYSSILDTGSSAHWNPLNTYPGSYLYSSIFLVLSVMMIIVAAIYLLRFGRSAAPQQNTRAGVGS